MAKPVFNDAVVACLDEFYARLSEAAQIAKAAQACAQAGSLSEAVDLDAASLLNRLSQD